MSPKFDQTLENNTDIVWLIKYVKHYFKKEAHISTIRTNFLSIK